MRIGAITSLIAVCVIYPFLPGSYDRLALTLSTMAQVFGIFGLLLVPVGILWLLFQLWKRRPGYAFALAALVASTLVALVISIVALASGSLAFGLLTLALWIY